MHQTNCLNCEKPVSDNFCSHCGQKTETHRIKMKNFFMHDLLHGVWHIERGMLFTLRETMVRPGQAALDYIRGKRVRYYNIFYLALLLIGINLIIAHKFESYLPPGKVDSTGDFFGDYAKFFIFGFVPIMATGAFIFFRRLKLNLAEHFILSGISLVGILMISPIALTFRFFGKVGYFTDGASFWLKLSTLILLIAFPTWSYFDATRKLYSTFQYLWRIVVFYIFTLVSFLLFFVFVSIVTEVYKFLH